MSVPIGHSGHLWSVTELEAATAAIAGPVAHVWVDGDHSLRRRDADVASSVVAWIEALRG